MSEPLGLRIVGDVRSARRLVDWRRAFSAHCQADDRAEPDKESYLSAFWFPAGPFRGHFDREGSERGYTGLCSSDWIWTDIDRADDPQAALTDSRRLVGTILERYSTLDEDDLFVFLSGGKGFHIGIPAWVAGNPLPASQFHETAKRLCTGLAERAGTTIDQSVYSKTRLFRSPNSRHAKTGLHKIHLTHDEFMHMTYPRIVDLAQRPRPFDPPETGRADPTAVADWEAAETTAGRRTVERRQYEGRRRLSRHVRDFLQGEPLEPGGRETGLFRVAAELAEMLTNHGIEGLIAAIVDEPALDSGLSPAEIAHAVRTGVDRGLRAGQKEGADQ